MVDEAATQPARPASRRLSTTLKVLVLVGITVVILTSLIRSTGPLSILYPYRVRLIGAEIALFGIFIVEASGQLLAQWANRREALQIGLMVRALVRVVGYLFLFISVLSILAANPALAVGVGSVTGLVVGLSAQNVLGNALAGAILAIARPFKVGSQVTVMGITGRVVDLALLHTVIDTGEREALVPNLSMLTTLVERTKER